MCPPPLLIYTPGPASFIFITGLCHYHFRHQVRNQHEQLAGHARERRLRLVVGGHRHALGACARVLQCIPSGCGDHEAEK